MLIVIPPFEPVPIGFTDLLLGSNEAITILLIESTLFVKSKSIGLTNVNEEEEKLLPTTVPRGVINFI